MAIPDTSKLIKGYIKPFWNKQYRYLAYHREKFNDNQSLDLWRNQGLTGTLEGEMADMRNPQPYWNHIFMEHFQTMGWKNVMTSYYRMSKGNQLPRHSDLYKRYIDVFNLQGKETSIWRAIVYLEDWQEGHWSEYDDSRLEHWKAGDWYAWNWDYPHAAGNDGDKYRYTLQITGHL